MSPEMGLLASKPQVQSPREQEGHLGSASSCYRPEGLVAQRLGAWVWNHTTWLQIPVLPLILGSMPDLFMPQFSPSGKWR